MDQIIDQFFNFKIMLEAWPIMWRGLMMTLLICAAVIPLGLIGGLLVALAGTSSTTWFRWLVIVYIDLFRAIPPLVLLILIYSGLPFAGIRLSPFTAVCLAFFLNNSAYFGEVYRAGIESIGEGQSEAARSTGLTQIQTMAYVVLPQAVRNVLPDLISNTIEVVKLTSLASVVALPELLYSSDMARSLTYNASPIVMAALLYLIILLPAVRALTRFEQKLAAQ
ncbi:MAG: amino acid ABC transporter permease [Hyphomicrobiales bacterium]|nr:amino acid ABC transporter permease [Hyphomicrobiales bacterium]